MAKDDLKDLSPEDRIKKLKKLEEEKKKEIKEAQKLIKDSEGELTERRKWTEKVPIPQVASEDLTVLSEAEKEIIESNRGVKDKKVVVEEKSVEKVVKEPKENLGLENLAQENVPELPPELLNSQYAMQQSQRPVNELYQEIAQIKGNVEERGYMTGDEERKVEYNLAGIEKKFEAEDSGDYSFTEKTAMKASLAQQMGSQLLSKNIYKSGSGNSNYQN